MQRGSKLQLKRCITAVRTAEDIGAAKASRSVTAGYRLSILLRATNQWRAMMIAM